MTNTNLRFVTGKRVTDVSVPATEPINDWLDDVVDNLGELYANDPDIGFNFKQEATWTIGVVGKPKLRREENLDGAGIADGNMVQIWPVTRTERYRAMAEDVIDAVAILNPEPEFGSAALVRWLAWWSALSLIAVAAVGVYGWSSTTTGRVWWAPALMLLGSGCAASAIWLWRQYGQQQIAPAVYVGGLVNFAAGAALLVPLPDRSTWLGAPQVLGAALATLVGVLIVRGGPQAWRAFSAFVAMSSILAALAAITIGYGWEHYVWALLAFVGLMLVTRTAEKLVIAVARIALPPIPAPGQDVGVDELLDPVVDIAAEAGGSEDRQVWARVIATVPSSSARLAERATLTQQLLAGFTAAGAAAATIGVLQVLQQGHFFVHTTILCVLVAASFMFRARLPRDRRVSWALLTAAAITLAGAAGKIAHWWPSLAPFVAAATVLLVVIVLGVVAVFTGAARLNEAQKRLLEWVGSITIAVPVPVLAWVAGLFDFARNLPWLQGSN